MAATIHEVARRAGVSASTVSRAFSSPDLLREATRSAVLAAAAELGYTPSRVAQGLVTGRTGNLGMLVPDIANPFFPPLVKGATNRAIGADMSVLLASSDLDPTREQRLVRQMAGQVDGLLLCSTQLPDEVLAELAAELPTVLVNRTGPGLAAVLVDTASGMRDAVDHLAALGHRGVVYLSGPDDSWSNAQRRQALRAHTRRRGLALSVLGPYLPSYESGVQAADRVLESGATAVIAYDDQMALGVLSRLYERGAAVPSDVSVIGCDDVLPMGLARPALTTVSAPCELVGRAAVELLLARQPGQPAPTGTGETRYPGQLVVRASTGPAPR